MTDLVGTVLARSHAPAQALSPSQLFGLAAGLIIATPLFATDQLRGDGRFVRLANVTACWSTSLATSGRDASTCSCWTLRAAIAYGLTRDPFGQRRSEQRCRWALGRQVVAMLAHERAHLHARHDLVLLPFRSLCSVLPASRASLL